MEKIKEQHLPDWAGVSGSFVVLDLEQRRGSRVRDKVLLIKLMKLNAAVGAVLVSMAIVLTLLEVEGDWFRSVGVWGLTWIVCMVAALRVPHGMVIVRHVHRNDEIANVLADLRQLTQAGEDGDYRKVASAHLACQDRLQGMSSQPCGHKLRELHADLRQLATLK